MQSIQLRRMTRLKRIESIQSREQPSTEQRDTSTERRVCETQGRDLEGGLKITLYRRHITGGSY